MANDKTSTAPPAESTGRKYWRSLEELADSDAFRAQVVNEFPKLAIPLAGGVDRRRFLQIMGASVALGSAACTRQPLETIVPYVRQPEQRVPGRPEMYATAATLGGFAQGILIESHEGRPTKVEGNPEHPASLGGTDLFTQATVLDLYDPDRSQAIEHLGRIRTWDSFVDGLSNALGSQEAKGGAGLRILTGPVTSPSLAAQMGRILERFPDAGWVQYDPAANRGAQQAAAAAAGRPAHLHYDVAQADVIVALDADFLAQGPGSVRYAKEFGRRRKISPDSEMNRLYVAESAPSSTGTVADHRLALSPQRIEQLAVALAAELGVPGVGGASGLSDRAQAWAGAVARDLQAHRGAGLIIAGGQGSAELHTLALAINQHLGNLGTTVRLTEPVLAGAGEDPVTALGRLVADLQAGEVEILLILGANPVYDAPAELDFAAALKNEATWLKVHFGARQDETAPYCHWHVPASHYLEAWGDARAYDGTVTIQQPLIEPLYGSKSLHELLAVVEGQAGQRGYDLLREHWVDSLGGEKAWRRVVHDGLVPDSGAKAIAEVTADGAAAAAAISGRTVPELELAFRPDPTIWDGQFANNGWLQECPKPLSKLTWDNALQVSPRTARRLGLDSGDLVQVTVGARSLEIAAWVQPGHADDAVTVHLGYGRTAAGRVGNGQGFDTYRLRTSDGFWAAAAQVADTGTDYELAGTQGHFQMENRHLVREASLEQYRKDPEFAHHVVHEPPADLTLYPQYSYDGYAWGMAINLSACTGCNACLVACQSENNIAVVGKDQIAAGREMHWLRIDQYYTGGDYEEIEGIVNQPLPCQQCEVAPCELVCPVAATVHSDEGLNDMVYNRCVGTRYCSNNCPYKVRRFNFFKYQDFVTPSLKLQRNPDVTVRFRGVMEKCTYCVQRISKARIEAHRADRRVTDGDVVTACQQACPTEAIAFGDINDADAQVAQWKADPLNYSLLAELGTKPRTTYLARVKNTNSELATAGPSHEPTAHG